MHSKITLLKDKDGILYSNPERSCKHCLNYPCLDHFELLRCDIAKYGCDKFADSTIFVPRKLHATKRNNNKSKTAR